MMILTKIKMCINLGAVNGIVMLNAILKKIKLTKDLFQLDIEDGLEIFIPKDLSQDQLPYSFRFYDPILSLINENLSSNRREFFNLRKQVAYMIHRENDYKQQFLEQIGVCENTYKEKKLTQKLVPVDKRAFFQINHNKSAHS